VNSTQKTVVFLGDEDRFQLSLISGATVFLTLVESQCIEQRDLIHDGVTVGRSRRYGWRSTRRSNRVLLATLTGMFKWICLNTTLVAVSFDLFGTLVRTQRPPDPATAIAVCLADRDVTVPDDWADAYREHHIDASAGAEVGLPTHVKAALASRGISAPKTIVRRAVVAAFDPTVRTREGAPQAINTATERGPVGILSNCAVPELALYTLSRSAIDPDAFDAVVTSVGCGWRKPDRRAFEMVADRLGVPLAALVHVGDDSHADGGATAAGARAILLDDVPLTEIPAALGDR
jgi:FMN phosphatase YigB (HAD superfamily)